MSKPLKTIKIIFIINNNDDKKTLIHFVVKSFSADNYTSRIKHPTRPHVIWFEKMGLQFVNTAYIFDSFFLKLDQQF